MKKIFFLALLANLVFFLWQYHAGAFQHPTDAVEFTIPKSKQILLLSELDKKPSAPIKVATISNPPVASTVTVPAAIIARKTKNPLQHLVTSTRVNTIQATKARAVSQATKTKAIPTATPATIAVKKFYCYQVGTFASKAAATHWLQTLGKVSLRRLKQNQPMVADYLVYFPATNVAESKKNMAMLKTQGINDFFMLNNGEFKGGISLGVFKNEAFAVHAQQVLILKGINAKVSKRYKTPPSVSAQIKTEKTKAQILAALTRQAPRLRVELLSKCE